MSRVVQIEKFVQRKNNRHSVLKLFHQCFEPTQQRALIGWFEVLPTTLISEIKNGVEKELGIPVGQQRLLLLGRTLADDQTVQTYPSLKNGTKLNLVVKKPDSFFQVCLKHFKKAGLSDSDALTAANKLVKVTQDKFNKLSWDDIDRLAYDCLLSQGVSSQDENMNISV